MVISASTATVVNIGLNLALIPSLAGTGAALATTLSYLVESVVALLLCSPLTGRTSGLAAAPAPAAAGLVMAGAILPSLRLPHRSRGFARGSGVPARLDRRGPPLRRPSS